MQLVSLLLLCIFVVVKSVLLLLLLGGLGIDGARLGDSCILHITNVNHHQMDQMDVLPLRYPLHLHSQ